jgi:hypothetical protein
MRSTCLFLIALIVVLGSLAWVDARHHHHSHHVQSNEQQDALYWLDKSIRHGTNSPMMYSYEPDQDKEHDKHKEKHKDNNHHDDKDQDDDDENQNPWFTKRRLNARANLCGKYNCPDFNSTSFPTFTKRSYPNTTVACATMRDYKPFGEAESFKLLYEYFGGENDGNHKLNMTVPVVRFVQPGAGDLEDGSHPNVTICFFLPSTQSMNPPVPKNSDVHVGPCSFDVLVHPFDGFSTHENVGKALTRFQVLLHIAGVDFNKDHYVHASYTEPWILWPRYNEIWLMQGDTTFLSPTHHKPLYDRAGPARLRVHHMHP